MADDLCDSCGERPITTKEEVDNTLIGLCRSCYEDFKKQNAKQNFQKIADSVDKEL